MLLYKYVILRNGVVILAKETFIAGGNPQGGEKVVISAETGGREILKTEVLLTAGSYCSEAFISVLKHYVNIKTNDVPLVFEHDFLTEEKIPVMLCYPRDAEKLPLVFFFHGFSADKFNNLAEGIRIAQQGYFTVVPDARYHGERKIDDFYGYFSPEKFVGSFFNTVKETSEDISGMIDYFSHDRRVDITRTGLTGISMGGFITFMAGTLDCRIKALAPIVGSPDWELLLNSERASIVSKETKEAIMKYSPALNYERFKPSALFVQNGSLDTAVPAEGSRRLDAKLRKLYSDMPDKYEYLEDPDSGHAVPFEMLENVIKWFEKHL